MKDINKTKEKLVEELEQFRLLVESTSDFIWEVDRNGTYTYISPKIKDLLGYEPGEVIGKTPFDLMSPGEAERIFATFMAIVEAKKPIERLENVNLHKNGQHVVLETSGMPILDNDGELQGYRGIDRDITERKQMEEEKAKTDARLHDRVTELSIMNEISEVLLSTRELNEILHMILIGVTAYLALGFNRAFLFLINEKENTLEGKVATGSLSAEEACKIWERLANESLTLKELIKSRHGELSKEDEPINNLVERMKIPLKGTESIFTQVIYEKKSFDIISGIHNPLIARDFIELLGTDSFALVPLVSRGKTLGVLLADNFITKKPISDEDVERLRAFANHASLAIESSNLYKSLEEKVKELSSAYNELRENIDNLIRNERLSAVGKVAAKITHEIRNPLVSIGGFARRILKKDQNGNVNRNYVKIIVEEINRLENTLTDVLHFAKPVAPQCDAVDFNRVFESTVEFLSSEVEKNNINVEKHLDPHLPMLWLDENQLRRVLINLIRNAIESMPGGGIITLSTINENQWVRVEIADTGVGITDDDVDKLFDAFFTSKSTSSGLGLTISAQIINNHGGTIEVQKRKPKGAIFTIKLPAKENPEKVLL